MAFLRDMAHTRFVVYAIFWLFSFIMFALCIARIQYTTHLPPGDTLDGGRDFYDGSIVFMLVNALLGFFFIPFVLGLVDASRWIDHPLATPLNLEASALSVLLILWFVGAIVTSSTFGDLTFCNAAFAACRVLTALQAFAWLAFIALLGLTFLAFLKKVRLGMRGSREKDLPAEPNRAV